MGDHAQLEAQVASLQAELRRLQDKEEIHELIDRYGAALDEKRWDDWEGTFAEEVVTDYPWGVNHGRAGMGEKAAEILKDFKQTEHLSGNVIIELDGDRATSRRNCWIICIRPEDRPGVHFTEGGVYRCEHVRTAEGWRFSRIQLDIEWAINGDAL